MKNLKIAFGVFIILTCAVSAAIAQDVSLPGLDGVPINVQGQKGKVVVLAIGATWLPLSRQQAIIANKIAKKFAGRDVVVYFVATDSTNARSKNFAGGEQLNSFVSRNRLSVPILRDSDGAVSLRRFNIDQLPAFVLINKQGAIASEPFGGLDPDSAATDNLADLISKRIDKIL
jgi:peroxiredoxin